ncbi:DUF1285 domain-containing protein [Zhongshania aquimaris]|uniref:DUF1285 domain-containing protein n=1 Tax=Zhongshania aquimaris TaxID=2857107 RepID=A0ABS6VLK1_9GAMM|nr:DUF1285 domain-containing protein [Zhongshania aquimaris]
MATLSSIETLLRDQRGAPPIDKWHPELSGDIDIVIKADGRWIHEGGEIKRHKLVKLFSSILRRENDGEYYLVTPVEKWRVTVEDLPLLIIDFECSDLSSGQRIVLKTNVDTWFELGAEHPLVVDIDPVTQEPKPSVHLSHGLQARINRASFYKLVEMAECKNEYLVLEAGGAEFELGSV